MSATLVDERVVEMQFDNKNFEKNVKESMSTIDKLNEKLKFDGAAKAFDNVNKSAKNVDLSAIKNAVEDVKVRFSGLDVAFATVISKMVTTAMSAGKQIVEAIAIRPIKSGLEEYQTYMTSIQTILSNTQSKGTTLSDVMGSLDDLNYYADRTIYNFTQMTRSIGAFTAAGIGLEDSTAAIKGISNVAAISGVNAEKASNSMYHFSQAMAAGYVSLRNWNGIVTAGMGGQVLQDELKQTARELGKDVDKIIEKRGSFRDSLRDKWLDQEVLTRTLQKFTGDLTASNLKEMGYADDEVQRLITLGKNANDAATKVKDLKQLIDTLNEALQSGWTQSWRLIVGDFYQARNSLTNISNVAGEFISKAAEQRNNYLTEILASDWTRLIHNLGAKEKDFVEILTNATDKYGTNNKKMFEGIIKNSETAEEAFGVAVKQGIVKVDDLRQAILKYSDSLIVMREDGRKAAGITDEQFKYVMDLSNQIRFGNDNLEEFIRNTRTDKLSSRENIFEIITESLKTVMSYVIPIKNAFADVFLPGRKAVWKFTNTLLQFVKRLALSQETSDRLYRIFKGLLSPIKLVGRVLGGLGEAFVNVFKAFTNLDADDIVEFFAKVADKVTDFVNRVDKSKIRQVFEQVFTKAVMAVGAIGQFIEKVVEFIRTNETIQRIIGNVSDFFTFIWGWITDNVPKAVGVLVGFWETLAGVDWQSKVKTVLTKVVSWLEDLRGNVETIIDNIKMHFETFANWFKNSKIHDYIVDMVKAFKDIGSDTVRRVQELLGIIPDDAKSRSISKFEEALLAIVGVFTSILAPGASLVQRLADDFEYVVDSLMSAFESIAPRIGPAFASIFISTGEYIRANGNSIKTIILSIIGIIVETAVEAVPMVVDGFLRMLKSTFDVLATRLPEIIEAFKDFVNKIFPQVKEILTTALRVTGLIAVTRILGAIDDIFETVSEAKGGNVLVPNRAANILKSVALILVGVAAIIGTLYLISKQAGADPASINSALSVLSAVVLYIGSIGALLYAAAWKLDSGDVKEMVGVAAIMAVLTSSIAAVLFMVALIARFNESSIKAANNVVSTLGALLIGIVLAIGGVAYFFSSSQIEAFGSLAGVIATIIGAIATLAGVVAVLAYVDNGNLQPALGVITSISAVIAGLTLVFGLVALMVKNVPNDSMGMISGFLGTATGALTTLAGVVAALSFIPAKDATRATIIVAALSVIISTLMLTFAVVAKATDGMNLTSLAVSLGMLALLIGVVGGVVYALGNLNYGQAWSSVAALDVILASLVAFIYGLQVVSSMDYSGKVIAVLAGLAAVFTGLGIAAAGLGVAFVSIIAGLKMMAQVTHTEALRISENLKLFIKAFTSLIPDILDAVGEGIATFIISIGEHSYEIAEALINILMDSILKLNHELPTITKELSETAIQVLGMLTLYTPALVTKLFDFLHTVFRNLIARIPELMTDFVDLVAAVFGGLADAFEAVDPEVWGNGLNAITYLGGLVTYLSLFGPMVPLAFATAVELGILFEELAGVIWVIGKSFGSDGALDAINKGGAVLEALGYGIGNFIGGIAGGAVAKLPGIGENVATFADTINGALSGVEDGVLDKAKLLVDTIKTLADAGFEKTAGSVMTGIGAFLTGGVSLIGNAIGGLSGGNPLDNFAGVCEKFGDGLSKFGEKTKDVDPEKIGNATDAIKTLAEGYAALPKWSREDVASEFMESMGGFGEGLAAFNTKMKGVSSVECENIAVSAKAITDWLGSMPDLTFVFGEISSWGRGQGGSIVDFQTGVTGFAQAMAAFGEESRDVKPGLVQRGVDAATSMYEMLGDYAGIRNQLDGFWGTGSGFKPFNDKEKGLGVLAAAIKAFGQASLEIDTSLVRRGADAGIAIGEMMDKLVNFPQFIAMITGDGQNLYDPDLFKTSMEGLAKGVSGFSAEASGIDEHVGGKARIVGNVMKFLADAQVDEAKGLVKWLTDSSATDITNFGDNLAAFGVGLVQFSGYTLGVTDTDHLIEVAKGAKGIADALDAFPDLTQFAESADYFDKIPDFGTAVKGFADEVDDIKSAHVSNVAGTARSVVDMLDTLANMTVNASQLEARAEAMETFGTSLSKYADTVEDLKVFDIIGSANAITALVNALNSAGLVDPNLAGNLINTMATLGADTLSGFVENMSGDGPKVVVKTAVSEIISTAAAAANDADTDGLGSAVADFCNKGLQMFIDRDYPGQFKEKGISLMTNLAEGFKDQTALTTGKAAINSMVSQIRGSIQTKYNDFYNAGVFLVQGFANGISGSGYLSNTAAYDIGANAVANLKSGAGENSPSVFAHQAGVFLGQGFANGIAEVTRETDEKAYGMGSSAVQAMNDAIANMSNELDAQLNTQPVIRPVLDLSNVQSRSHMLSALLSRDQAMLIGTNVNNEKALEIQNGLKVPEPGDSYSFVQNNYSPKALSRIEIYRQTKNQFSAMKGLATES